MGRRKVKSVDFYLVGKIDLVAQALSVAMVKGVV